MPAQNDNPPGGFKIEMFRLANRLKARLGSRFQDQKEGFIAADAIAEADKLIEGLCLDCSTTIGKLLDQLSSEWQHLRASLPDNIAEGQSRPIFTTAHEIKDVSAMCGLALLSYFAESLRDYIGRAQIIMEAQIVIIQAHIDAMQMAHRKGVREDHSPEAEELKRMVRKAIEKYQ